MTGFMEAVEATMRGRGLECCTKFSDFQAAFRRFAIDRFACDIMRGVFDHRGFGAVSRRCAGSGVADQADTLVVPFTPGALTDVVARMVSDKVAARLGQPVIVENKPCRRQCRRGAVSNRRPTATRCCSPTIPDSRPRRRSRKTGFRSRARVRTGHRHDQVRHAARRASLDAGEQRAGVHCLRQVAPGQLNFASPGVGMPHNLAMELLKQTAGVNLVHVLYKGGAMATRTCSADACRPCSAVGSYSAASAGRKTEGDRRLDSVASCTGAGHSHYRRTGLPGFDVMSWVGMMAPAGTPADIVAKLASETQAVLSLPEVKEQVLKLGLESMPMPSPAAFGALVRPMSPSGTRSSAMQISNRSKETMEKPS